MTGVRVVILPAVLLALVIAAMLLMFSTQETVGPVDPPDEQANVESVHVEPEGELGKSVPAFHFVQLPSQQTGVDFTYFGSPTSAHNMTEQNGGGVALADFDADGILDIFFTNGSTFDRPASESGASNILYRGMMGTRFSDTTIPSGLRHHNFGQGVAAGDFDNDGFTDLFVAAYDGSSLWKNNGDGTFRNVSATLGTQEPAFSTSAAFADLNADGNLDLVVVNYLDWNPDGALRNRLQSPMDFLGQTDFLYQNTGDGGFREVSSAAGVAIGEDAKGLAIAIADFNADKRLDIFVANDTRRNFLFQNSGQMSFQEIGVISGAAVSQDGSIGSSMGVAISDYNRDGKLDLFVTNFAEELVDVLANMGETGFMATNTELGVDTISRPVLNFGIVSADFDLDTWPDLFFANGHLWDATAAGGQYKMLPSILRNDCGRSFLNAANGAGEYFEQRWLGRSTGMGDLENDGDVDLVVCHQGAAPAILKNDGVRAGQSQRVVFVGTLSCRQPLGCQVMVELSGGLIEVMTVPSGGSFQASHDPVLVVPTGNSGRINAVSICWPDGTTERWLEPPKKETVRLVEGTGKRISP